ncbi:MAG: hypothetical protein AAGG80_06115 [Pseudomonadota bacterium]
MGTPQGIGINLYLKLIKPFITIINYRCKTFGQVALIAMAFSVALPAFSHCCPGRCCPMSPEAKALAKILTRFQTTKVTEKLPKNAVSSPSRTKISSAPHAHLNLTPSEGTHRTEPDQ